MGDDKSAAVPNNDNNKEKLLLGKGSLVEVSTDEEGFKGAYYAATLLDPNPKHQPGKVHIQYHTLLSEDGTKPLQEFVNSQFIRPVPPPQPHFIHNNNNDNNACISSPFALYDVVDAYYYEGWWTGVIVRLLDHGHDDSPRVVVAFQNPPDLLEFRVSYLRLHLDWDGDKWIRPDEIDKRSKRHRLVESDNHVSDPLNRKAGRIPKSPMSSTQSLLGGKVPGEQDNQMPDPLGRKVGQTPTSLMSDMQASAGDETEDTAGFTKEKFDEKVSVVKENTVTLDLEHEAIEDPQRKESCEIPREQSVNVLEDQRQGLHYPLANRIKEGNKLGGGESISRRKRGRPRKFPAKIPEASAAVNQQNGGVTYDMVVENSVTNEVGSPQVSAVEATSSVVWMPLKEYPKPFEVDDNSSVAPKRNFRNTLNLLSARKNGQQNAEVVQNSDKQLEKHSSKRARRRTISINAESLIQDRQDVFVEKTAEISEKDSLAIEKMSIDQLPSHISDDLPLSMWFEGMQSPRTCDSTRVYHDRNMKQHGEKTKGQKDLSIRSSVHDTRQQNQTLPFVKSSPLWKVVESMEVFQKMPQKPHFRPLESSKETSREGLAVGYMVNFASVSDKTSSLQFDCSRSVIEDLLETLLELENHGFDVKFPRDRLTGLLLMKDKQEELQDQSKETTSLKGKLRDDTSKIDEKIAEIHKKISLLQEECALALSIKQKKDLEIAVLESRVGHINNALGDLRLQFEALAAAPW